MGIRLYNRPTSVSPDNIEQFTKELQEFYNTPIDSVVCTHFNPLWLTDLDTVEADAILFPLAEEPSV